MNRLSMVLYGIFISVVIACAVCIAALVIVLAAKQVLTQPESCATLVTVTSYL